MKSNDSKNKIMINSYKSKKINQIKKEDNKKDFVKHKNIGYENKKLTEEKKITRNKKKNSMKITESAKSIITIKNENLKIELNLTIKSKK